MLASYKQHSSRLYVLCVPLALTRWGGDKRWINTQICVAASDSFTCLVRYLDILFLLLCTHN